MKYLILFLLVPSGLKAASMGPQPSAYTRAFIAANQTKLASYSIRCDESSDECSAEWAVKDGQTVASPVDKKAIRAALLVELSAIEDKLDAGKSLTAAEIRRVLKIVIVLTGYTKAL